MEYNDFIIPLAWPEAPVRTAGGPYDKILQLFNLHRNGYYKAGHAAFLLINSTTGQVDYYDFGRYISPNKNGRARSKETDPEVIFDVKAKVKDHVITNFDEIIQSIGSHPQTHGEGTLYAGIQRDINHAKALAFIQKIQEKPYTPYGPFVYGGTNCSRFVAQTIAFSVKAGGRKFLYPWYLTPAPLGNIFYSSEKTLYKLNESGQIDALHIYGEMKQFNFMAKIMKYEKGETTPDPTKAGLNKVTAPARHPGLSPNAQWLGGIGAGAWYEITYKNAESIEVKRTQGNGDVDYIYKFTGPVQAIDFDSEFNFEHGSHGMVTLLSQKGKTVKFVRV
ncbi:MAG: hypothetical protein CMP61_06100 [Flavobacteriales bacterium]|nr:hypothetical protein [Flavobacteriales bacterium]|tara:strand:+ start:50513 stop:51514 length:1002 start_codon:yes stop_codon:yes gene_type:complete